MEKLYWLATAVAAVSMRFANAQLAQVDNDTMPTSMFMTRPQSLAPVLNITHSGDFSQGYIFIGPYQHPGAGPYIFDKFGNLVWDGFGITGSTNAHDFKVCQYRGKPHLCFSQMNQRNGYGVGQGLIIDSSYRVVASVQTGRDAMPADMHEMNVIDDEDNPTAILTSYRAIPYDLSGYNITTGMGWLSEGMFQEIDIQSGEVLFEWYSSEHVDPSDSQVLPDTTDISGDGLKRTTAWDYYHINSVDKSKRTGNYLVSARHVSSIYYVNATDQSIIWTLSYQGRSDFECMNFNFSYQHDARIVSENDTHTDFTFFDNASNCYNQTDQESSGRFITIDHETRKATQTRRVLPPGSISSCSQGNTQLLENGSVFQGWGDKSWISEHDADDNLVLAAHFTNGDAVTAMNYRAFSFGWESTPANTKPAVYSYARTKDGANQIHVSWNGATTVATWTFYAAQEIGQEFKKIGSTGHRGFETIWTSPEYYAWIMVEAVAWDGNSLGNSSFQPTFVPSSVLIDHCDESGCQAATTFGPMAI
ncbi:hypothetical protein NU195Hw_g2418t1 [Hortaea werneckii]